MSIITENLEWAKRRIMDLSEVKNVSVERHPPPEENEATFKVELHDGNDENNDIVFDRAFDIAQDAEWTLRDETGGSWYLWVELT